LGIDPGVVTLYDNSRLAFYIGSVIATKPIIVDASGGAIENYQNNNTIGSPVTMNGNFEVSMILRLTTQTVTLTGPLSGVGSLNIHAGDNTSTTRRGTVALTSDANNFTGSINVGGGGGFENIGSAVDNVSLSVGNGGTTGSIGTGQVTVGDHANLIFNKIGAYTISNMISGGGTVVFAASGGSVTLTGASDYFGDTVVKGGSVELTPAAQAPITLGSGVDIQNGRVLFDYGGPSPVSSFNDLLKASYATSNGTHPNFATGQFRNSTATAAIGLGISDNGSAVTVAAAYYGDANLDGTVNALDFNALASHFGGSGMYWYQGDFNYDGIIDTNDFAALATNFGAILPPSSMPLLGALVPEPTCLALLGVAVMAGLRRRARCSR